MERLSIPVSSHRRWGRVVSIALAFATVLFTTSLAQSQDFELNRFHPATSPRGDYITVHAGNADLERDWAIGFWAHWSHDPLVIRVGDDELSLISDQVAGHLVPSYSPLPWLRLSLDLPFYMLQNTDNEEAVPNNDFGGAGLGDLRFIPKFSVINRRLGEPGETLSGPALALLIPVAFPIGNGNRLQGEEIRFEPRLAFDYATYDGWGIALNVGYLVRPADRLLNIEINDMITYGLAGRAPLVRDKLAFIAEVSGEMTPGTEGDYSASDPLELWGMVRATPGDWVIGAGAGPGLIDGFGAPDYRVFLQLGYEPRYVEPPGDCDEDGYLDDEDQCECEAEDFDDFEDEDGCPDPDNDSDTILDVDDGCRGVDDDVANSFLDVAEDFDSFEDVDGCPEVDNDLDEIHDHPVAVDQCPGTDADVDARREACSANEERTRVWYLCVLEPTREVYNDHEDEDGCPDIMIAPTPQIEVGPIYFNFDVGDEIQDRSRPTLEAMANILRENPEFTLVQVQAHTDSRGTDAYNERLSAARAATVRRELIALGVDASRLESVGKGESEPFFPNAANERQHQANRRVEFWIMEVDGEPVSNPDFVTRVPPQAIDPDPGSPTPNPSGQ